MEEEIFWNVSHSLLYKFVQEEVEECFYVKSRFFIYANEDGYTNSSEKKNHSFQYLADIVF